MDFFGMILAPWQFWLIIAVLVVVIVLVIAVPIYKGYKAQDGTADQDEDGCQEEVVGQEGHEAGRL